MFGAYFLGSYFPTGWGGASEPAAPGTIAATIVGGGALTGALEALEGGTGEMGATITGLGSMAATLAVADANPSVAGGGGGIQLTARSRRAYSDLAMAADGMGTLGATLATSSVAMAEAVCTGRSTMAVTMAVTERQAVIDLDRRSCGGTITLTLDGFTDDEAETLLLWVKAFQVTGMGTSEAVALAMMTIENEERAA